MAPINSNERPVDVQIVIPAFNEERRIGSTLGGLFDYLAGQQWSSRVVVVDNGSSDSTSEVVDRIDSGPVRVNVVGCSSFGRGAAVRRGVLHGSPKWVGVCDAHGSIPYEAIGQAIRKLEAGADVVVGARQVAGAPYRSTQPVQRRVTGVVFRHLVAPLVPTVGDVRCGFKFFRRRAGVEIFSRTRIDGFGFNLEVLALARSLGYEVAEIPVEWSDADRSPLTVKGHGQSVLRELRDIRSVRAALADDRRAGAISRVT